MCCDLNCSGTSTAHSMMAMGRGQRGEPTEEEEPGLELFVIKKMHKAYVIKQDWEIPTTRIILHLLRWCFWCNISPLHA